MKGYFIDSDSMQNYKKYAIPSAQLIIADVPYNIGNNFYGSNLNEDLVKAAFRLLEVDGETTIPIDLNREEIIKALMKKLMED